MPGVKFDKIRKRNGRLHKFKIEKIEKAILAAGTVTGEISEAHAKRLTLKVLSLSESLVNGHVLTVEQIQDVVEEVLLHSTYKATAKEYIIYREQQNRIRRIQSAFDIKLMSEYIDKTDWEVNENSNMDYSLQGLNNHIASKMSKKYWLDSVYPGEIRDAHIKGDFHIHDLSALSVYCVGWDLFDVLVKGFTGVEGKIASKPAKHFRTALGQVVNFFYTLQGESAGAQAFSNFDTLLAPFIRYDKLTYSQVKQCMQEFIFNINVPTRVGFQTPFTNLTMDLSPSQNFKDTPVIHGGVATEDKYGDFQKEMDVLNKAFFEVMLEGDADGRIFTFPIPTYNITKEFDWENKNLELLWKITAKYGIPYFSNFINSDMKPEDARSMCCRLRLDNRELEKRGGGLFGANPLTGSIGVVTINMPRLAFSSQDGIDFMRNLGHLMDLAKESLEIKRKVLERLTDHNLYPYTKFYLASVKKRFHQYWKNHFSTIGLVGMNEACLNLLGDNIASKRGHKFSIKVLDYMRKRLLKYQSETGNNYNLEATPAEGTAYRLALKDKATDKNIVCANEDAYKDGAQPYYTNSTQLPVDYTDNVLDALDLQDELQCKYTGGTVLHCFLGERVDDVAGLKVFIKKICENYKMPYFTISPTFSICPVHGYVAGEHEFCPKCDLILLNEIEQEEINDSKRKNEKTKR